MASSLATPEVHICRSLTLASPLSPVQAAPSSMATAMLWPAFPSSSPVAWRLRTLLGPLLPSTELRAMGSPDTSISALCTQGPCSQHHLGLQPQQDAGTLKGDVYQLLPRPIHGSPLQSRCVWDPWSLFICHLLGPWGPQTCL